MRCWCRRWRWIGPATGSAGGGEVWGPGGGEAGARGDAVPVPGPAVDRAGHRLGRGGGSFDRALARVGPLVPLIALLYDDEPVDRLPAPHPDVPVRAVVRPAHGVTALPAPA